jgi:hypothetical protein
MKGKSVGYQRNAREKRKKKTRRRTRERNTTRERVCQRRSGKIKSKRDKDTDKQERGQEGRESKNPDTIGSMKGV